LPTIYGDPQQYEFNPLLFITNINIFKKKERERERERGEQKKVRIMYADHTQF
jgi:hypothetical protein